MTDDQDEVLNSTHPYYMPNLDSLMRQKGMRFSNVHSSVAVCCPARASFFTGKTAHCTNITGNGNPGGGYIKFAGSGLDRDYLPVQLQGAGYNTYFVGKFMNGYTVLPRLQCPLGWNYFDALTNGAHEVFDSTFNLNCAGSTNYPNTHQTDVIIDKSLNYIRTAVAARKPFYMHIAPTAPHKDQDYLPGEPCFRKWGCEGTWNPPHPPTRYATLYAADNLAAPRTPNFGVRDPSMPVKRAKSMTASFQAELDYLYVQRLRSLKPVDDLLGQVVSLLQQTRQLDNTYIIFLSDNGYHIGQFGLEGKALPVEEDVRVPLYIRGPGIPSGVTDPSQINLIDLAPTILLLAGRTVPNDMDGIPLPVPTLRAAYVQAMNDASSYWMNTPTNLSPANAQTTWRRECNLNEFWNSDGGDGGSNGRQATAKSLRLCSSYRIFSDKPISTASRAVVWPGVYCYKYNVWCTGDKELYDLSTDPFETTNRVTTAPQAVLDRLDAVMSALVHCRWAVECTGPYSPLHPDGSVISFAQAMDSRYDSQYRKLLKFKFNSCASVYLPSNEPTWLLQMYPAGNTNKRSQL